MPGSAVVYLLSNAMLFASCAFTIQAVTIKLALDARSAAAHLPKNNNNKEPNSLSKILSVVVCLLFGCTHISVMQDFDKNGTGSSYKICSSLHFSVCDVLVFPQKLILTQLSYHIEIWLIHDLACCFVAVCRTPSPHLVTCPTIHYTPLTCHQCQRY